MHINTIILEDNPVDATFLQQYCESTQEINLEGVFHQPTLALTYLEDNPIDLLFLDVEMPEMSGLEMLDKCPTIPQVIMTTSNTEYAYDAFEYQVVDFLKKPLSSNRLSKTLEKVIRNHENKNKRALQSAAEEIYVKSDGKLTRVPYSDIFYFENVGDYIKVITERGNFIIYGALKSLAEKLTYERFLKVHRSYIVNLSKVVDIEDNSLLINKKMIPISRAHKSLLIDSINII